MSTRREPSQVVTSVFMHLSGVSKKTTKIEAGTTVRAKMNNREKSMESREDKKRRNSRIYKKNTPKFLTLDHSLQRSLLLSLAISLCVMFFNSLLHRVHEPKTSRE